MSVRIRAAKMASFVRIGMVKISLIFCVLSLFMIAHFFIICQIFRAKTELFQNFLSFFFENVKIFTIFCYIFHDFLLYSCQFQTFFHVFISKNSQNYSSKKQNQNTKPKVNKFLIGEKSCPGRLGYVSEWIKK